ncbi:MAG: tRNA adenosine(34) deaminase TadA [Woeseiaceae bacterium]|nr:tRNA adenosine(34) deaminase TadA [Woeseiaceae bacterium]
MSWSPEDTEHMHAALGAARQAEAAGEVPVGAVVVAGGKIVADGHNISVSDADPSGHAEVVALRAAANALGNHRLNDATLYVTLEPCVMCVGAMAHARISRVVFGAYDMKAGALGSVEDLSMSRALNHRFEVNGGVLADECGELLRAFFEARR